MVEKIKISFSIVALKFYFVKYYMPIIKSKQSATWNFFFKVNHSSHSLADSENIIHTRHDECTHRHMFMSYAMLALKSL